MIAYDNPMARAIPDGPVCILCGNDIDHWTHDDDPERRWCRECVVSNHDNDGYPDSMRWEPDA